MLVYINVSTRGITFKFHTLFLGPFPHKYFYHGCFTYAAFLREFFE